MLIGYARVSTLDQNLDLQRDALTKAGCERLFEEKRSGKAGAKRPEFEAALAYLRSVDVLVVWKLDRLGRSLVEMMRTLDGLRVKDVHFRSLTEQFDAATAHGRFALQMHGAMAEYFLDLDRERTMEGLKAALARSQRRPAEEAERGRHRGRPCLACRRYDQRGRYRQAARGQPRHLLPTCPRQQHRSQGLSRSRTVWSWCPAQIGRLFIMTRIALSPRRRPPL